jgi:outer membrane protein assembly factor BamB
VIALDADTGKTIWDYKFNLFQSDVPPHRIAWASPAADPETGNIYALSAGAQVVALSKDGKLLWDRSLGEEYAAFTTHGGRTMSPIIDGNLVIVSAAMGNWGTMANRSHRFAAFDTHYIPLAFPQPGLAPSGFLGENGAPRTFGVRVGATF